MGETNEQLKATLLVLIDDNNALCEALNKVAHHYSDDRVTKKMVLSAVRDHQVKPGLAEQYGLVRKPASPVNTSRTNPPYTS